VGKVYDAFGGYAVLLHDLHNAVGYGLGRIRRGGGKLMDAHLLGVLIEQADIRKRSANVYSNFIAHFLTSNEDL